MGVKGFDSGFGENRVVPFRVSGLLVDEVPPNPSKIGSRASDSTDR